MGDALVALLLLAIVVGSMAARPLYPHLPTWSIMSLAAFVAIVLGPVSIDDVPKSSKKMEEVVHRRMRCTVCGFEAGRDVVAVLNIEKRARDKLGNPTFSPLAVSTPS